MKLNLLPTYVSRGRQLVVASIISAAIALLSVLAAVAMVVWSRDVLETVRRDVDSYRGAAQRTVDTAAQADTMLSDPNFVQMVRNINLARAMDAHNSVYPEFYNRLFPYIPAFFRINSVQAVPIDGQTVTVTMNGIIKTERQYADLMLALLRIPGSTSVTRTGFTPDPPLVPPVTEQEQNPRARRSSEPVLPQDPLARLDALIAQGSGNVSGFQGAGGFGSGQPGIRGAMPNHTQITVTVTMPGNLMAPNPRATFTGGG